MCPQDPLRSCARETARLCQQRR